jgi:TonB family protein
MNWQFLFANGTVADWILLTAFHSLWLSLATFLIVRVRKFGISVVRSTWCTSILILLLALPLVTWFVPRPVIRAHRGQEASITTRAAMSDTQAPLLNNLLSMETPVPQARANPWKARINQLGFLWLVVTLGCVGRLLYGLAFLRGYCNCLRELDDDRLAAILKGINESFDFRLKPRFFLSRTLPSPVSIGIRKPVVILPAALYQSVDDGELRAILLHELAHIHHSDHLLGLLQRLAKALYWWNPCVYGVCSTLTTAREEVSDNYAISAMGNAASYATLLVGIIEKAPLINGMPCVAGMATPYQCLQKRIWHIVSGKRDLRVKAGKGLIFAISATAALMCGLVCLGSQVRIFGTEPAVAPEKGNFIETPIKTRQVDVTAPSPHPAAPTPEAPRESAPNNSEAVQKTEPTVAPASDQAAIPLIRRTNLARSDSLPALRNEHSDAPQTIPVQLDESNPPVIRSRVEPEITAIASRARLTATVSFVVVVNEKGEVYEVKIRIGHPLLNQSAVNAVLQWKFEPLFVDGAPRAFMTTVDLHFKPE